MRGKELKDFAPIPQDRYLSPDFALTLHQIGLSEMSTADLHLMYTDLLDRARIGLHRTRPVLITEGGLAADEGLAAFRTGIPTITAEAWNQVEDGTDAYVASVGGTNFEFHRAFKESGRIATRKLGKNAYEKDETKKVSYNEFVARIVDPVADHYNSRAFKAKKLRLGVSLGFPHNNIVTNDGIDATLEPLKHDGTLTKQWKITDWEKIPLKERHLSTAIKNRFEELGVDPARIELVILNDTPATALDVNAIVDAQEKKLSILPVAAIGGTGTNHAALYDGKLINMESGRSIISDCMVTQKMLENIAVENGEPVVRRELEHEIGGKYIIERLRAGIQILGAQGMIDDEYAGALSEWIRIKHEHNPSLLSEIAAGNTAITDKAIQFLAQQALKRAGQFFGITTAAIAEAVCGERRGEPKCAVLTEGSFVNYADNVKRLAENTASRLGQPIEIVEASSVRGAAGLAMARPYLELAA
jgi:hypothetical protein